CINADFLKGMGAVDERFLMILDIDKVLSTEELLLVTGVADAAAGQEPTGSGSDQAENDTEA
ncbi:MAG TPA: chemotaxis protein CheW, partial [Armatimonadetes bacterium]|nr:chemotaxis protein CheW [Armatimonadota bacterium]